MNATLRTLLVVLVVYAGCSPPDTALTVTQAEVLVSNAKKRLGSTLSPTDVTSLAPDAAAALAKHSGPLHLHKVTSLTPDVAKALLYHKDSLALGVTSLTPDVAAVLSQRQGRSQMMFSGLPTLTPEAAMALAPYDGSLAFACLTSLTPEVARALSQHRGHLAILSRGDVQSLTTITPEVAEALAGHEGELTLHLSSVSDDAAEALAKHKGKLSFGIVIALSERAIAALRMNPDVELPAQFTK